MGLFKKDNKTELQKLFLSGKYISERDLVLIDFFIYIVILEGKKEFPKKGLLFLETVTDLIISMSKIKIKNDTPKILAQVEMLMNPQYFHDATRSLAQAFVKGFSSDIKVCSFKFAALAMYVVDGKFNSDNGVLKSMLHNNIYINDPYVEKTRKQFYSEGYIEGLYLEYCEFIKLVNTGLGILSEEAE